MKKIALISTFCDNQEKLDLLYNNIKIIKELNIDVMLFTPFSLPEEINKLADYVLISKENPILDWPVKSYYYWFHLIVDNTKDIKMSRTYPDHGYAGLNQVKRMADLALSMDYDLYFPMIYDVNINEHVKSVLLDNKKNSFFPSIKDNTTLWPIGLHLISLDKEHLIKFKNLITKESYLTEIHGDAFSWLGRALFLIPGVIENEPVEDLICYHENFDFFNYSFIKDYKLFIHKKDNENTIKILFYDFEGTKIFKIVSDTLEEEFTLSSWDFIELPFNNNFLLKINNIDYTETVKSIGQNILEINNIC